MPKTPIKMKDSLDRFYTKPGVAKTCIESLISIVSENNLFVEPSAGAGAFFRQLPTNKVGVDLSPAFEGVIKCDWFEYEVPKDCIVVGNPPFGSRNSLSKAFIAHAVKSAKCVAFILPRSYNKETTQKVFPSAWALVKFDVKGQEELDRYNKDELEWEERKKVGQGLFGKIYQCLDW